MQTVEDQGDCRGLGVQPPVNFWPQLRFSFLTGGNTPSHVPSPLAPQPQLIFHNLTLGEGDNSGPLGGQYLEEHTVCYST